MSLLRLEGLTKRYDPNDPAAVDGLSLSVEKGEIVALLGPSGCGKTTTIRLSAGFAGPDAGVIAVGGKVRAGGKTLVPPERRGVGVVFQDCALFPHLTVEQNIAFGLRRLDAKAKDERVGAVIEKVNLVPFAKRYPHEISGGQEQRVALARALAPRPALLLLDEPLGSLDAQLRDEMIVELKVLQRQLGLTTLYITHDQAEAMKVADELAVMKDGRLEQVGPPELVYRRPRSRFVATFLGKALLLEGHVKAGQVETPLGTFPMFRPDGRVTLALRPEDIEIDPFGTIRGRLIHRMFLGEGGEAYVVDVNGLRVQCSCPANGIWPHQVGEEVGLTIVQTPAALED
ncbi:MAG: ABC transporter ATP-binding protein [Nitrospinota bacterium]